MGAPISLPSPQDPPSHHSDERPRIYRLSTPRLTTAVVSLGGVADDVTIRLMRPVDAALVTHTGPTVTMSRDEAWALWACLSDGLGAAGASPDWVPGSLDPIGADGTPLPSLVDARPF